MESVEIQRTFDYASLDSETRVFVQIKTGEIRERSRRAMQYAIDVGERLLEVKERLDHGQFGDWLRAEFEWSDSMALRFMRAAERFKNVNLTDLNFSPSALYLLSSPSVPEEARQEAVEYARNGNPVTHKVGQEIARKHRSPRPAPPGPRPGPVVPQSAAPSVDEEEDEEPPSTALWDDSPAVEEESQETEEDEPEDEDEEEVDEDDEIEVEEEFKDEDEIDEDDEDDEVEASHPDPSVPPPVEIRTPAPTRSSTPEISEVEDGPPGFSKLWKFISLFLVSLPRRGGIGGLMRGYSRHVISGTHGEFLVLRETVERSIQELEEEYPWLRDQADE